MATKRAAIAALALLLLSGCGTARMDRALSGAGIGAAAGFAAVNAFSGDPVTAMVVGGIGGAVTGALTSEEQLYFGKPFWKNQ